MSCSSFQRNRFPCTSHKFTGRLFSCQSLPGPCISIRWFFQPIRWISWNLSTYLTILDPHHRSNNRRYFLQHYIPGCICSPGHVDVCQWNWEWCFFRHVQFDSGFYVMTGNKIAWDRPEIIPSFTIIQRWVLKYCWRRSVEDFLVLVLGIWAVPDQGGQRVLPFHLRLEI